MPAAHLVVLSTCPDRDVAEEIADTLVDDGHAACVNIVPGLTSVYRWAGEVHRDEELLLIAKTTATAYRKVEETILRLHPDELPEVIAVPLEAGLNDYLHWVTLQTTRDE
ncbi:MAG TPA: divalent-cation tolerance protein CutA [Gammaproteobacteria bacterium]|nr:divalent-cation tolerance protein CutA [Gammaproteobacteria bacterium]